MTTKQTSTGNYVFHVRSYELGPGGQASLASLCHLLQEAASLHAHALEASPEQLLAQGMTWFLARMRLKVERYPGWRDAVTVETWPSAVEAPFAVRDFRVFDEKGQQIAVAASWWLLMDTAKRRPIRRFPPEIVEIHPLEPKRALDGAAVRLPRIGEAESVETVRVRGSDVDLNAHVNHVFYVDQVEQAVPAVVRESGQVAELEVEFKAECHAGDDVSASTRVEGEAGVYLHSLSRHEDGREVARARTVWTTADDEPRGRTNR